MIDSNNALHVARHGGLPACLRLNLTRATATEKRTMFIDEQDLTKRALRAYCRAAGPYGYIPSRWSGLEWGANGRPYIVLTGGRSESGIAAVFRIKNDGRLKRLERWPSDLG